jgi:hypothetical protein
VGRDALHELARVAAIPNRVPDLCRQVTEAARPDHEQDNVGDLRRRWQLAQQ